MSHSIFLGANGVYYTPKSASDDAMSRVWIHHFNLLPFTSIIPLLTTIVQKDTYTRRILPGTVQPVVVAHFESD